MAEIKVDGYSYGAAPSPAPKAAEFGKGAANLAQIKQAAEARVVHSKNLTEKANSNDRHGAMKYRD